MIILNENIDDLDCYIEEDFGPQKVDNSLIEIKKEYNKEGNVFFITVLQKHDVEVYPTVKGTNIEILAIHEIINAFSNKDDSMCKKCIKDLLPNADYDILPFDEFRGKTILIAFPKQNV